MVAESDWVEDTCSVEGAVDSASAFVDAFGPSVEGFGAAVVVAVAVEEMERTDQQGSDSHCRDAAFEEV